MVIEKSQKSVTKNDEKRVTSTHTDKNIGWIRTQNRIYSAQQCMMIDFTIRKTSKNAFFRKKIAIRAEILDFTRDLVQRFRVQDQKIRRRTRFTPSISENSYQNTSSDKFSRRSPLGFPFFGPRLHRAKNIKNHDFFFVIFPSLNRLKKHKNARKS